MKPLRFSPLVRRSVSQSGLSFVLLLTWFLLAISAPTPRSWAAEEAAATEGPAAGQLPVAHEEAGKQAEPEPLAGPEKSPAPQGANAAAGAEEGFVPLFPHDGKPRGWSVRQWDDLSKPAAAGAEWLIKDGVLYGSRERGTWLISDDKYGDFELRFEFKLGARGNSGCALRAPLYGDPAFDGMELQMVDLRYKPDALDSELTGGIYRAIAPRQQVYKPLAWNEYKISLVQQRLVVHLNGELIHDLDLFDQMQDVKRHDGTLASAVKDRPQRGHIGFQELSRDGVPVEIRRARLKVLDPPSAAQQARDENALEKEFAPEKEFAGEKSGSATSANSPSTRP